MHGEDPGLTAEDIKRSGYRLEASERIRLTWEPEEVVALGSVELMLYADGTVRWRRRFEG